ncbi:hypothetical protein QOT17_013519 [Balamuthia mandrillaris]
MKQREEAEHDVPCCIDIPVRNVRTSPAQKRLLASKLMVEGATSPTLLGGVVFIADDHVAPWILSDLVQEPLTKPVVGPSQHGILLSSIQSSSGPSNHPLGVELGRKMVVCSTNHLTSFLWRSSTRLRILKRILAAAFFIL